MTNPSVSESARKLQKSAKLLWESLRAVALDDVLPPGKKSKDDETAGDGNMALEKLENLARIMFSSCTSAMEVPANEFNQHPPPAEFIRSHSKSMHDSSSPRREANDCTKNGPHVSDEHKEVEKVINSLREKGAEMKRSPYPSPKKSVTPKPETPLPRLFPASSPKHAQEVGVPAVIQEAAVHGELSGTPCMTFDDGISAISADTLDEMAKMDEIARNNGSVIPESSKSKLALPVNQSEESSISFPCSPGQESEKAADYLEWEEANAGGCFVRTPSQGTRSTRGTKSTLTKSTWTPSMDSTQTSGDFESKWRRDEQNYWNNVVAEEDRFESEKSIISPQQNNPDQQGHVINSANRDTAYAIFSEMKLRRDPTISTIMSSDVYSSLTPPFGSKHPHDTIHYEACDVVITSRYVNEPDTRFATFSHPDRISEMLVLPPNTEMAEI